MNGKPKTGSCVTDSFITFQKLYCINSKRVRGRINNKSFMVNYEDNNEWDLTHYWVEAQDYVYDNNNYQIKIMPKNEYYLNCQISDVEYAETDGIFNKNNYILGCGPDTNVMIMNNILPKFKYILMNE